MGHCAGQPGGKTFEILSNLGQAYIRGGHYTKRPDFQAMKFGR